ncbi:MAG: dinitrogenase iron-molybdenum cofactor biosynthesis protein [Candidatus Aminicenantes bacterium]|nr:dinitrogenase iron-molybdenum cofactor biosynthesis protein [Candidatus Aminicenantes bacterium]
MKIAVSASSPDLSSPVDPRFGRCPYFLFVDPESMEFEAIENPNISSASGVGIQSAQLVAEKGAKAVLTGSCGPNAFQTLQAAGVEVIIGISGTVKEAVAHYKSGQVQATAQANVPSHSGMGGSGAMGSGFGMGRGMGGGMGRGMGYMPPPQSPQAPPPESAQPQMSPEEEMNYLKQQAELLKKQMENISKKIEELEKKKT